MTETFSRREFLEIGTAIAGGSLVASEVCTTDVIAEAADSTGNQIERVSVHDGILVKGTVPFFPIGFVMYDTGDAALERAKAYGANSVHTEYSLVDLYPDSPDVVSPAGLTKVETVHKCAAAHGLTLFPLLTGHYIPEWLRKQAGGRPVDATGRTVGEWFEFSIHNAAFLSALSRFWTAVGQTVGQDPNVGAFVMWNEPAYGMDSTPMALRAYRLWLSARYRNIGDLNVDFKASFTSFDEVVPPATPDAGRAAWYRWGLFNQEAFADFFAEEARIFHAAAPPAKMSNKHPALTVNLGARWSNDVVLQDASQDIYGCDRYGSSAYQLRDAMEVVRSLNAKGPVITYEWNPQRAIPPRKPGPSAVQFMAQIIGGARGLFYYYFDGDREFAYELDEATSEDVRNCISQLFRMVRDHPGVFAAPRRPADIAVLLSTPSTIHYGTDPDPVLSEQYTERLSGAYDLVRNQHFAVDFISDRQFAAGKLSRYKLLIVPSLSILSAENLELIGRFHREGGRLLAFGGCFARDERFNVIPPPAFLGLKSRAPMRGNRSETNIVEVAPELTPYFDTELIVQIPEMVNALSQGPAVRGASVPIQGSNVWLAASALNAVPSIVESADGKTVYCAFDSLYGEGLSCLVGGIVETRFGLVREVSAKRGGREALELLTGLNGSPEGNILMVANNSARQGSWECRLGTAGNIALRSVRDGKTIHSESGLFTLGLPAYGYDVLRIIA